jgi:uncharacterized YigZ family protein
MMNAIEDYFLTIEAIVRGAELKVKGSRFIPDLLPVTNKEEIESALSRIRKEFHDATHHCYAYRLGEKGLLLRAADDGEPSGTAGRPILLQITSAKLTNVLLVVTRYYGGTNLGTGGLARAYGEAAHLAIAAATIKKVYQTEQVTLKASYHDVAALERYLLHEQARIVNSIYEEDVRFTVEIRSSMKERMLSEITDAFGGRVTISFENQGTPLHP